MNITLSIDQQSISEARVAAAFLGTNPHVAIRENRARRAWHHGRRQKLAKRLSDNRQVIVHANICASCAGLLS